MTVWIAFLGLDYEGSNILGVFSTREEAIKCALDEEPWDTTKPWKQDGDNYWRSGSQTLSVSELQVQDKFISLKSYHQRLTIVVDSLMATGKDYDTADAMAREMLGPPDKE